SEATLEEDARIAPFISNGVGGSQDTRDRDKEQCEISQTANAVSGPAQRRGGQRTLEFSEKVV
ncbi:hypothetical protein, partial [Prosthecobacter sp.]|uniref:hypothetical protein n=1 Tax=Prosthecobacter sp. TaxID=1965333 RepID=UPI001DC2D125